ncbi:hypothetical protein ABZ642_26280 [Streptomyces sp. NPDC007157]|uniref:hypothetical protein n=1 Tax=Streptomyces sp. NPDC007157 TaxID=3154681 RepID=UPI0033C1AD47
MPYTVHVGVNNANAKPTHVCNVNQATKSNGNDVWGDLGTLRLWQGAGIQLDNVSRSDYTGDQDVAYDAVVFQPTTTVATSDHCFTDSCPFPPRPPRRCVA